MLSPTSEVQRKGHLGLFCSSPPRHAAKEATASCPPSHPGPFQLWSRATLFSRVPEGKGERGDGSEQNHPGA